LRMTRSSFFNRGETLTGRDGVGGFERGMEAWGARGGARHRERLDRRRRGESHGA